MSDPAMKRPQIAYEKVEGGMFPQCGPLEMQGRQAELYHHNIFTFQGIYALLRFLVHLLFPLEQV